jgi:cytochrome c oxidase accessory protein FixG
MKLDRAPLDARKFALKAAKHATWIALAFWTGFTFVGYFTPIRDLAFAVPRFELGPWETFWVFFYGFATYGNAGWMREQVCKYMCPYARFQSAMFDQDTLVIEYDALRGEPRGSRGRKADPKAAGLGSCVDCNICVQVCPTGIDIRDGLQYECIGCAACVDACDQVMDKMGYPRGLIRYSTQNATKNRWDRRQIVARVLRPRVLVYSSVLGAIVLAMVTSLFLRVPLKVDVIRDRASLARQVEDDKIENVYRLQVMNTRETATTITIAVKPTPALGHVEVLTEGSLEIPPTTTRTITVRLRAEPEHVRGSVPIEFVVGPVTEKSRFLVP